MEKSREELIEQILEIEWNFFTKANNTGGRADCQDNREEFVVMRKSQWDTMPQNILESYYEDLQMAVMNRINIVVEKYARMMEFSVPTEYEAIKHFLSEIPEENKKLVDKMVEIYLDWEKKVIEKYPKITGKGRPLYSVEDTESVTSIETYLRGELYSYSKRTLDLYYEYMLEVEKAGRNLALENIENIVLEKGFEDLDEAEKSLEKL